MLLLWWLQELGVWFRVVHLSAVKVSSRRFPVAATTWLLHCCCRLEDTWRAGRWREQSEVLTHLTFTHMHVVLRRDVTVLLISVLILSIYYLWWHKKRWITLALLIANIVIVVYLSTNPTFTFTLDRWWPISTRARYCLLLSLFKSLCFIESSIRLFRGVINAILLLLLGPIDSKRI